METKRITDISGLEHLWQVDNLFLAGQPSAKSIDELANQDIKKIINLRADQEADQAEIIAKASEKNIEYIHIPAMVNGQLSAEQCEKISKEVNTSDKILIHCASANRVGAWLITYLCKHRSMDFDAAVDIAASSGLSNPAFIAQVEEILEE